MPSRNILKDYSEDTFYHVYNRGVNKRQIFIDNQDYSVFLNLLKRYLSKEDEIDKKGRVYVSLYEELDLISFCLMPNHFHLFLFQNSKDAITKLLRSVCGSYTIYFNKKYERIGPLFQSRYKASTITNDAYFMHISRYIHINPKDYTSWEWSSLPYYLGSKQASWVKPGVVMDMFKDGEDYLEFLGQYIDYAKEMKNFEANLAHYNTED